MNPQNYIQPFNKDYLYYNLKSDTFMSKIIGVLLVIGSVIGTVACIAQHQFNPFTGVLLLLVFCFGCCLVMS